MSAIAGFLLASSLQHHIDCGLFAAMLVGTSLVIACGCVINNIMDRGIDAKMSRTKQRAMVTGQVTPRTALVIGLILGIIGFHILLQYVNNLTAFIGFIGLFFYLILYGYFKRRSTYGTLVGSVSGATPMVAGYTAVTNHFDLAALILFFSMVFWQMPHFYAIALYRLDDYKRAKLPVMPVSVGVKQTIKVMPLYIIAFTVTACALTPAGYTRTIYVGLTAALGIYWLLQSRDGPKTKDTATWARHMFMWSLLVLVAWSAAVAAGAVLP